MMAHDMTATSGRILWTDGARYGPQIETYKIQGRTNYNRTWVTFGDRVEEKEPENAGGRARIDGRREYYIEGLLSPWAAYSFRVAAYNNIGLGEWCEPSPTYNTRPEKPDRSVTHIRSDGGRTGDLTVRWRPLAHEHQNAPGIYYRVYYRRTGVDEERDFQQKTLKNLGNVGMSVIRISRDYYFTTYEVGDKFMLHITHI